MQQQLDRLAAYDSDSIGCEFSCATAVPYTDRRQHEARRMQLKMDEFKTSFSDSQRIPKAALKNTCRFETQRIYSHSLISLVIFIILTALAGIACALLIYHLNQ